MIPDPFPQGAIDFNLVITTALPEERQYVGIQSNRDGFFSGLTEATHGAGPVGHLGYVRKIDLVIR